MAKPGPTQTPDPRIASGQADGQTLRLVLVYAGFAALWILLTDQAVTWLYDRPDQVLLASMLKGWLFVAFTSLMLYVLVRRLLAEALQQARDRQDALERQRRTEAALRESEERYRNLIEHSPEAIVVHRVGKIIYANPSAVAMVGAASPSDMLGRSILDFALTENREAITQRVQLAADPREARPAFDSAITNLQGERIDISAKGVSVIFDGEAAVLVSMQDITQRKRSEELLQAALRDKDALLREVHHRVKNNLQVIDSLLRMEVRRSDSTATRLVLQDMQGRIHAMALLHEMLYRSGTFAAVELGAYLRQLATRAVQAMGSHNGAVRLCLDLDTVHVDMDQAVPCGLLTNELVSNCLKHGFPDGRSGDVHVTLKGVGDGQTLELQVRDTGVGLPADFEARRSTTLGLQLATDLAGQMGGQLRIGNGHGAVFTVDFAVHRPRLETARIGLAEPAPSHRPPS